MSKIGKFKKFGILTALTALCLSAAGCGSAPSDEQNQAASSSPASGMSDELSKIYEDAKKEGKVIYWTTDDKELEKIREGFSKKFPGIQVENFEIEPQPALEKIITESSANQTNVDVFDLYYLDAGKLLERDLVQSFDYNKVFGLSMDSIDYDNKILKTWHISLPIVYNTNLVKEDEVPKSWDDLLDPKWKGKILLEARGLAFPTLSYAWGEEKTVSYVEQLLKQDPMIVKGGTPSTQAIVNGQAAIGVGPYAFKVEQMKAKGAPIDWAKTGPIALTTHITGALKNAPHPNAALLFAYYLASDEGLKDRMAGGGGERLVGELLGPIGQTMEENKIERLSEQVDKEEVRVKVAEKISGLLSSLQ